MMTREGLRSSSITPAIENIYLSSEPISPEEKAQMLRPSCALAIKLTKRQRVTIGMPFVVT